MSLPAFGLVASAADLVKSAAGITTGFPSLGVTVAFPFSSTTTVASGFTALTLAAIASFSSCVNESGFATTVLSAGLTTSFPAFGSLVESAVLVKSAAGITATLPSLVTVAFPLLSTTTSAPGFTALTFSSIAFFSSGVRAFGFATTVLSAGVFTSFPAFGLAAASFVFTKSFAGITTVLPSLVVTVAFPLSSTTTVLASGFTSATLAAITFCSSVVNDSGFSTTVLSAGLTTSFPAFGSLAESAVLVNADAGITAVLPSLVVTVAFPLSSIAIVAPGFTSATLAAIASFSSCVNGLEESTATLSAGVLTLFPAFGLAASSFDFTKSATGIVAISPSLVVTVAFPLSSNTTLASGFTALIASVILALSTSVNASGLLTTTLSAGVFTLFPAFGCLASS